MNKAEKVYICEYCKKAPQIGKYRRNYKWKTLKGFENHSCYKDEQEAIAAWKREEEKKQQIKLEKWLASAKHKVGEEVYFVSYWVTKPTHIQRGTHLVRVRYEEKRRYVARFGKIRSIALYGYVIDCHPTIVYESDIFASLKEAQEYADEQQKAYDDHCALSAQYR